MILADLLYLSDALSVTDRPMNARHTAMKTPRKEDVKWLFATLNTSCRFI